MRTERRMQAERDRAAAKLILEELDRTAMNVNWPMKERYITAIITGMKKAREGRQNEARE